MSYQLERCNGAHLDVKYTPMSEITPTTLQEIIYSGQPSVDVAELNITSFVSSELETAGEPVTTEANEKKISAELATLYLLIIRIQMLMYFISTKQFRLGDALPIIPGFYDVLAIGGVGALKTLLRRLGMPY